MIVQSLAREDAFPLHAMHLVEEINHRVVNEFTEAILALSVVADNKTATARDSIFCAMGRLSAHVEAHRALLPPRGVDLVNLADYIERLCTSLSKATLADNRVYLKLEAEEIWLDPNRCWRIGLIIAELVRNAARHGLAGRAGEIGVRLVEGRGSIECLVCDNGESVKNATPGRGLQLVHSIAEELGGTVAIRFSPAGGMACVRLPYLPA